MLLCVFLDYMSLTADFFPEFMYVKFQKNDKFLLNYCSSYFAPLSIQTESTIYYGAGVIR